MRFFIAPLFIFSTAHLKNDKDESSLFITTLIPKYDCANTQSSLWQATSATGQGLALLLCPHLDALSKH